MLYRFRNAQSLKAFVLLLLIVAIPSRAESVNVTTQYHQLISLENGVHPLFTPVQHYRGKTFLVMPDRELHPLVTEIDESTGKTTTVLLDQNPDYKAFPDGHQRFTLGIDPDGYLHIAGDMHGYTNGWTRYVERYVGQNMMYWRSNRPLDVTGGFTFTGGEFSTSRMPGIEWGGDSRFFNDRNGVLFYSSRVRAFYAGKLTGTEPFIAYGIYRYDHTTGIWTALGGTAEKGSPDSKEFQKVLYWEWTHSFEAYQSKPRFDNQNRLHFAIGGNTANTEGNGLIYAVSGDLGDTWKKANGTAITSLPLRGKDGELGQGDLIERSKKIGQQAEAFIDKDGKVTVNNRTWDGSAWVPYNGSQGLLGPDGMLTQDGTFNRSAGLGQPLVRNESGFGQTFSFSEMGLQFTGAIYGVGLPRNTNFTSAKKMWVFKATFDPTEVVSVGGTVATSTSEREAALVCDGDRETAWSTAASAPQWIAYTLSGNTSKAVCRYELTSAEDLPQCDPRDWDLEGSNDGKTWIVLDTRKNQFFGNRNQTRIYAAKNDTPFSKYRLSIKACRENVAAGIKLAELKLLSLDSSEIPAAPVIFVAHGDDKKVWLSWTQPNRAATFNVKRAVKGEAFTVIAKELTDPGDFRDSNVTNGTEYQYVISAQNAKGEGPDSAPVTVTPNAPAPRAPLVLTADGRNQAIVLSWLPLGPTAASYTVKRSASPGGPYETIAKNVPGITYTDIGLKNDSHYYYVISASNAAGIESPNSKELGGVPYRWVKILHYKTADTGDTGVASASAENPPRETAAQAFNGATNDKWLFFKPSAWLQYSFAEGTTWAVTRYQILNAPDAPDRDPMDWEFQASKDGTNWVTLDTQKNQSFSEQLRRGSRSPRLRNPPMLTSSDLNAYAFENSTAYRHYRLNISKTHSQGIGALCELILFADGEILKAPTTASAFPSAAPIQTFP